MKPVDSTEIEKFSKIKILLCSKLSGHNIKEGPKLIQREGQNQLKFLVKW